MNFPNLPKRENQENREYSPIAAPKCPFTNFTKLLRNLYEYYEYPLYARLYGIQAAVHYPHDTLMIPSCKRGGIFEVVPKSPYFAPFLPRCYSIIYVFFRAYSLISPRKRPAITQL